MANIYKNAFFDPSDTSETIIYATDGQTRAIIQNIQLVNESGAKTVTVSIYDKSNSNTAVQVGYITTSGATIENLAKGPLVLEEEDTLVMSTTDVTGISAVVSILEVNRGLNQQ